MTQEWMKISPRFDVFFFQDLMQNFHQILEFEYNISATHFVTMLVHGLNQFSEKLKHAIIYYLNQKHTLSVVEIIEQSLTLNASTVP